MARAPERAAWGPGTREEYGNKGTQWCEYDRLARLAHARNADANALRNAPPGTTRDALRMVFREEWRIEQEVGALSKITRLDSGMVASGQPTIGRSPGGQLTWGGTSAELRGLEEEELGMLHALRSEELARNPYLAAGAPGGDGAADPSLLKGTVDHKAQATANLREKLAKSIATADATHHTPALQAALLHIAQVIHMCEIRLKRARSAPGGALPAAHRGANGTPDAGSTHANHTVLWDTAQAGLDPFLVVCRRLMSQRKDWLDALHAAVRAGGGNAPGATGPDPDEVRGALKKIEKAAVTLRKIEAYRFMGYERPGSGKPPAGGARRASTDSVGGLPSIQSLHGAPGTPLRPESAGFSEGPAASAPSSIPASPVVPVAPVHHTPRTITPVPGPGFALPETAAATAAKTGQQPRIVAYTTRPPVIRHRAVRGRCHLAPPLAASRIQRWWRRRRYWRRVAAAWVGVHTKAAVLDNERWRQGLAQRVALADKQSHPLRRRACVAIQRVVRGWLHGRAPARVRRRAVAVLQRYLRGAVARRYRVHAVRLVAEAHARRAARKRLARVVAADKADAHMADEYVERVLSLTAELRQQQTIAVDEERRFRREWKEWEEKLTQRVVEEMPLDTSDWAAQPQPDGTTQWLHLKTKRTTTKHPNLQFADIHRKRQWVKVGRVREERKKQLQARVVQIERALGATHAQFEGGIVAARAGQVQAAPQPYAQAQAHVAPPPPGGPGGAAPGPYMHPVY